MTIAARRLQVTIVGRASGFADGSAHGTSLNIGQAANRANRTSPEKSRPFAIATAKNSLSKDRVSGKPAAFRDSNWIPPG